MENNVAEKVMEIITREQHLEPGVVKLDSSFTELGIDSLDAVNILFALEAEFASKTAADYLAEGQKMVELIRELAEGVSSSPKAHKTHH